MLWSQLGRIRRRKIRCFNVPKERKASDVRQTYVNVRNHFLRPIYKRPEILLNRIITAPNLGTIGLIRRKVAVFLAVRTVVGENISEVFFSCTHGGRGKYFGGFFSCPHGGQPGSRSYSHGCDQSCDERNYELRTSLRSDLASLGGVVIRTYVRTYVRTTARSRPSVSPKAEAKGGVWGGAGAPPSIPNWLRKKKGIRTKKRLRKGT